MTTWLVVLAVLLPAAAIGAGVGGEAEAERWAARIERALAHRAAPLLAGLAGALAAYFVWGSSLHALGVVHDEAAYLFQARTFALGRWAMPSPPLPQFFEQYHLLVVPTYAAKYPPGHALLLLPGILLRVPGLVPVLLNGIIAGVGFALARRAANGFVALLALLCWLSSTMFLRFAGSYLSELSSGALWMVGWWSFVRWRERRSLAPLLVLAGCTGWMAITRPLTAVAFATPLAIVILAISVRERRWRDIALAFAVAVLPLTILPLWSHAVTGDWRTSPYGLYGRQYIPWDAVGLGLVDTPPERAIPPDMEAFATKYRESHAAYTMRTVPGELHARLELVSRSTFGALAPWLAVALLAAGAFFAPAVAALPLASTAAMLLFYLPYWHPQSWAVYYFEIVPGVAFVASLGVHHAARWIAGRLARLRGRAAGAGALAGVLATGLVALLLVARLEYRLDLGRTGTRARALYYTSLAQVMDRVPAARLIAFVRYKPDHSPHSSLIYNEPDLAAARIWWVYDRGAENAALLARSGGRRPYLVDETRGQVVPLAPDGVTPAGPPVP